MPKSRGRRRPKRQPRRPRRPQAVRPDLGDMEVWWRAMALADDAEARGDATGALEVMEAFPEGPDGRPFWRPTRVSNLLQVDMFGPMLPPWVFSRWICAQALQSLDPESRDRTQRALAHAVDIDDGAEVWSKEDPADAVWLMDHDWAYRQLFLYDLGGLASFVRRTASSALIASADSIHEWARSPMGAFRHLGTTTDTGSWVDVASDQTIVVPNIGSAVGLAPDDYVIGRIVPVRDGLMFESAPLPVQERTARLVAERPHDWCDALKAERSEPDGQPVVGGVRHDSLTTDVPDLLWHLALVPRDRVATGGDPEVVATAVARCLLEVAVQELEMGQDQRPYAEIDPWPCLAAAFTTPGVVEGLAAVATQADVATLQGLGGCLAEPAAAICLSVADALRDAA